MKTQQPDTPSHVTFEPTPEWNYFPFCVDGFFKNPDLVRDFALSQDFCLTCKYYPGSRTKPLNELNRDYFNDFCNKLFSLLFDFKTTEAEWNVKTHFHMLPPLDSDPNSGRNIGLVHSDYTEAGFHQLAGVIYLTPNIELDTGTSLFRKAPSFNDDFYDRSGRAMNNFYDTGKDSKDEYEMDYGDYALRRSEMFEETARFNNIYNRIVAYPASISHAFNSCYTKGEPRLTQVFFVQKIDTSCESPIQRMRKSSDV